MKNIIILAFVCSIVPVCAVAAEEQGTEIAAAYTYVRANAPPGQCDCFSMNGGSISLAHPLSVAPLPKGSIAAVFDATLTHASDIAGVGYSLTLSTFTVGARYRPMPQKQWSPFVELLLGASHATGSLVEGDTPAAADSRFKFAGQVGGGIDRWIGDRWSLRLLEVDYLRTTYSNRVTDYQNNLRVSVGAAYHF